MKKKTVELIDDALVSWKRLTPAEAKIQTQYGMAQELSAISQCIKLGILDEQGKPSERTKNLIAQYRRSVLSNPDKEFVYGL